MAEILIQKKLGHYSGSSYLLIPRNISKNNKKVSVIIFSEDELFLVAKAVEFFKDNLNNQKQ